MKVELRSKLFRILFVALTVGFALAMSNHAVSAQNVNVTATAGTASATYATVKGAFDAINAGTHQGVITIGIANSTAEGATPAVLNSSGAGSASYTSILIQPTSDGVTVSGASPTGRGVIELNGADNVTINGDNPNTAGINRNLTITNTAANTVTFTSVIRIALAATVVTSADNVAIKNLNINGSSTGRNVSGASSTTGSENTTYGIVAGGGASTVSATTAPSALASITTTAPSGSTASNLSIDNNNIQTAARGIAVQGGAATVFPAVAITNNLVGNSTLADPNQVTAVGITAQGSANGSIAKNTVYVEGFVASSSSNIGIGVGNVSANGTFTIERNFINRVTGNAPDFWAGYGILLAAGNGQVARNNFISNVTVNTTSGGFYSTTFNASGIRIAAGLNHQVYHNSINMNGTITGATPTVTACFTIIANTLTGLDIRNNICVNTQTNGSATSAFVAFFVPSGGTASNNWTINNNDYWNGAAPTATQGIAQVGTTSGTGFFTLANFDPTQTTPATNFRSYSSTLSAAGTNDNASKKVDPQFVGATDLHIAVGSPMVDAGATVGVSNDIDGQNRVPPPDIGADEPSGITPPANDMQATAFISPTNGSNVSNAAAFSPSASFTNNGTAAQTNVTVRYKIINAGNVTVYNSTAIIPSIASGQTLVVTFAPVTLSTPGTYTIQADSELAGDAVPANDLITGSINVIAALSAGNHTVGTGGEFPSLTNPGGIFEAINAAGAAGPITISIISDLSGETGAIALNEIAGGPTVTIQPSGAARTITGSSGSGILRFTDTDNVTIDGSLTGATTTAIGGNAGIRNLTVQNTSTAATGGAVIALQQTTNGSQNFTIKNVNVVGQDPTQTLIGIHIGGATIGAAPTANHNNVSVHNCAFQKSFIAIFDDGVSAANPATGNVLSSNDISATGANRMRRAGIFTFNHNGIHIVANRIGGIVADEAADAIGIIAGVQNVTTTSATDGGIINALIERNIINGITSTNTTGFSAVGIAIAGSTAAPNTIQNNFVLNVLAPSTSPDITAGIFVAGVTGSSTKVLHNSVSLTGDRGAVASQIGSFGIAISGTNPTVQLTDNIFYNTQTSGGGANAKSYAIGMQSTTFTNLNSNFNDFFTSGAQAGGFRTASLDTTGTDFLTLAGWQGATGQDANSQAADPLFINPTADLHLQNGSPLINTGTNAGVNSDIDLQPRPSGVGFDIGADEVSIVTASKVNVSGRVLASNGAGLRNAVVYIIDANGNMRTVNTGAFGSFTFDGVEVGQYVVGVKSRQFNFTTQQLSVQDSITDLEFYPMQ
jgi:hypothetical protein